MTLALNIGSCAFSLAALVFTIWTIRYAKRMGRTADDTLAAAERVRDEAKRIMDTLPG